MRFHTKSIVVGLIASITFSALMWSFAGEAVGVGAIVGGLLVAAFLFVLRKREETQ